MDDRSFGKLNALQQNDLSSDFQTKCGNQGATAQLQAQGWLEG